MGTHCHESTGLRGFFHKFRKVALLTQPIKYVATLVLAGASLSIAYSCLHYGLFLYEHDLQQHKKLEKWHAEIEHVFKEIGSMRDIAAKGIADIPELNTDEFSKLTYKGFPVENETPKKEPRYNLNPNTDKITAVLKDADASANHEQKYLLFGPSFSYRDDRIFSINRFGIIPIERNGYGKVDRTDGLTFKLTSIGHLLIEQSIENSKGILIGYLDLVIDPVILFKKIIGPDVDIRLITAVSRKDNEFGRIKLARHNAEGYLETDRQRSSFLRFCDDRYEVVISEPDTSFVGFLAREQNKILLLTAFFILLSAALNLFIRSMRKDLYISREADLEEKENLLINSELEASYLTETLSNMKKKIEANKTSKEYTQKLAEQVFSYYSILLSKAIANSENIKQWFEGNPQKNVSNNALIEQSQVVLDILHWIDQGFFPERTYENVSICVATEETRKMCLAEIVQKNIQVKFEIPETLVVSGHSLMLRIAFLNLMKKCLSCIPKDGNLTISASKSKGNAIIKYNYDAFDYTDQERASNSGVSWDPYLLVNHDIEQLIANTGGVLAENRTAKLITTTLSIPMIPIVQLIPEESNFINLRNSISVMKGPYH
jgi:hypothetical protein